MYKKIQNQERYLPSQIGRFDHGLFRIILYILIKFIGVVNENRSLKVFWQKNDKLIGFFGE